MKGYNRTHSYVNCTECDYSDTDISNDENAFTAGQLAQRHANEMGHRVNVEIAFSKYYMPEG